MVLALPLCWYISKCNEGEGSRRVPKPGDGGGVDEEVDEGSVSNRCVAVLRLRREVRSISESKRSSFSRDW